MSKKELKIIELFIQTECINYERDMVLSDYPRKRIKKEVELMREYLTKVYQDYVEEESYQRLSDTINNFN